MRWWTTLGMRLRTLLRREVVDAELDAELRFHLEAQVAENVAAGMPPDAARFEALRALGGVSQIVEECREARRLGWIDALARDVRFAARILMKSRGFTAIAVVTLAVGIGFNTLAFSVGRALLFGHLPVDDPDHLVLGEALREGFDPAGTSLVEYVALRQETDVFSSTALSIQRPLLLRAGPQVEQIDAAAVSPGFFETLGSAPVVGRTPIDVERRPGGPHVVLLAYALWQRDFGGDPAVVGRTLTLDDRPYTVIGIMPRAFDYPTRTEAWVMLDVDPESAPPSLRTPHGYIFVARLRPDRSRARADEAVKRAALRAQQDSPQTERGWSYGLLTMRQWSIGDDDGRVTKAIVVLLVAIGFLLVICCVNVANLLMVRGIVRERELAIRVGLGASTGRIAQQLLTEGAVLAMLGAGAGLAFAWLARPIFAELNPIQPHAFAQVVNDFPIDRRALLFCLAASTLSGIGFTLFPILKLASVRSPLAALRQHDRRAGAARSGRAWLRALVVTEIAASLSLSFGGALLTKSFYRLGSLDLGFRPDHLLTLRLPLSATEYPQAAQKQAFLERVLRRVRALPGVQSAGLTSALPMQEFSPDAPFTVEGRPAPKPSDVPIAALRHVSEGYAETLGLTLVRGRLLTEDDRASSRPVALITEELARQAFGGADAIGRRLRRGREQDTGYPWLVVVGVVKDTKEDRLNFRIARPVLYLPYAQRTNPPARLEMALVVRAAGDPAAIANAVGAAIHGVEATQPVLEVASMHATLESVLSTDRFSARIMALLAAAGLLLAGIGLYSVIAYAVSQRTGEIGLRVALGARPASVVALIAREVGVIVAVGVAMSVPVIAVIARLLSGVLFAVNSLDPDVLFGLAVLLPSIACVACAVPIRRALRLEPLRAIQCE